MSLKIGSCVLGKTPKIAAIIDKEYSDARLKTIAHQGPDFLEIRADGFALSPEGLITYVKRVKKITGLPLLCTVRLTKTNGNIRFSLYKAALKYVDAIDVDCAEPDARALFALADKKTSIASFHDFSQTPADKKLESMVVQAKKLGADIVKIAALAKTRQDAARLMSFCAACPMPIVAISMGPFGTVTRAAAPLFGSLFTFAFVNKSNAPGQISLPEMVRIVRTVFPHS
jgi:3-dehydroquinate dehydratase-1